MEPAQSVEPMTETEERYYRLSVVNRLTQREIAERCGVTQQAVSDAIIRAKTKLPPVDVDAAREASRRMQRDIQRRALELAEMIGTPVTAGKDGDLVLDPKSGEYVRDYSLRLAALELARKADVELRKLDGLDAATKIEQSGSVRYEVEGVNISALS